MEKAGEIAKKGGTGANQNRSLADVAPHDICGLKKLPDLGITRDQSSRYKALANAPDEVFESAIGSTTSKPTPRGITPWPSPHARVERPSPETSVFNTVVSAFLPRPPYLLLMDTPSPPCGT